MDPYLEVIPGDITTNDVYSLTKIFFKRVWDHFKYDVFGRRTLHYNQLSSYLEENCTKHFIPWIKYWIKNKNNDQVSWMNLEEYLRMAFDQSVMKSLGFLKFELEDARWGPAKINLQDLFRKMDKHFAESAEGGFDVAASRIGAVEKENVPRSLPQLTQTIKSYLFTFSSFKVKPSSKVFGSTMNGNFSTRVVFNTFDKVFSRNSKIAYLRAESISDKVSKAIYLAEQPDWGSGVNDYLKTKREDSNKVETDVPTDLIEFIGEWSGENIHPGFSKVVKIVDITTNFVPQVSFGKSVFKFSYNAVLGILEGLNLKLKFELFGVKWFAGKQEMTIAFNEKNDKDNRFIKNAICNDIPNVGSFYYPNLIKYFAPNALKTIREQICPDLLHEGDFVFTKDSFVEYYKQHGINSGTRVVMPHDSPEFNLHSGTRVPFADATDINDLPLVPYSEPININDLLLVP